MPRLLGGNSYNSQPRANVFELSVFGPGYGESSTIHIGNNEWVIVDSCTNNPSSHPKPIEYLHTLGIDPAGTVKLIVATHWHDDHVRGLGAVLDACPGAAFSCSQALKSKEFLALTRRSASLLGKTSSGVDEFAHIVQILQERGMDPEWAIRDRLLWRRPDASPFPCEIHSLSPSDAAITLAQNEIAKLLPEEGPKRSVIMQGPNHTAVVIWIQLGEVHILLGSDLEETTDANTGWSVIVEANQRPQGRASMFKVPHHGSSNADQPRVWSEMLDEAPIAILTPFIRGSVSLPKSSDIERICQRTPHAFTTSAGVRRRSQRRSSTVERTIRETARRIHTALPSMGHVRVRGSTADRSDWTIELFGDARYLNDIRQSHEP